MNAEFINPFISSLRNIMSMMAQTELKVGRPNKKSDAQARGDVSGLIGMVSPKLRGSISITFDEALALSVMEGMLGERPEGINSEVTDMVGEITNMVAGGAKKELAKKGFDFGMATPVVVAGKDHVIAHQVEGPKMILPFKGEAGYAYMEICFDKGVQA